MGSFILGVLVTVVAMYMLYQNQDGARKAFEQFAERWLGRRGSQVEEAPPNSPPSVIEPPLVIEPPNYGNIRLMLGEDADLTEYGPDVHEFPETKQPTTRFEDFNRRLFILSPAAQDRRVWPDTTDDDFPTRINGMTTEGALAQIRLRLRPRYPVIYDTYGHWAAASQLLEQDPDYNDIIVSTYLALPEEKRPVVVSLASGLSEGAAYTFMRYGFQDFRVTQYAMRFHQEACLALVMSLMVAPRKDWLWLSVARMRQTVIRAFQANEAKRRESQATDYMEQQTQAAKKAVAHQNRFLALWQNRVEPQQAKLASPDSAEAAE